MTRQELITKVETLTEEVSGNIFDFPSTPDKQMCAAVASILHALLGSLNIRDEKNLMEYTTNYCRAIMESYKNRN